MNQNSFCKQKLISLLLDAAVDTFPGWLEPAAFDYKSSELAVMAAVRSLDNERVRDSSRKFLSFILWLFTVAFHFEIKLSIIFPITSICAI